MIISELISALTLGDVIGGANTPNKRLDTLWRKQYGRVLTAAALTGTAGAAGDGGLELFEDTESLAKIFTVNATNSLNLSEISPLEGYIPAKHKLQIECIDTMSNTAYLLMSFLENRPGESLIGKTKGSETTLFENLGTMSLNQGLGMEATKNLGYHMVDEVNDRFVTFVTLLGGGALVDSQIEFTVDGDFRGSLHNLISTTVAPTRDRWLPANIYIPAGATFDISCIDAFAAADWIGLRIAKLIPSPNAADIEAAKPQKV